MQCPECNEKILEYMRLCPNCEADVGFPNVRKAKSDEELSILNDKVELVRKKAKSKDCADILDSFEMAVRGSFAVICSSLGKINELISDDNALYSNYYKAIGSEGKLPQDNKFDVIRTSVDNLFFPNYFQEIRFGALSIDGVGVVDYGNCCMALKDLAIKKRATVFTENIIMFANKNNLRVVDTIIPAGNRAAWPDRSLLALAKLGDKITSETKESEFQNILMPSCERDGDFIEVHIYGLIKGSAIERITFNSSTKKYRKEDSVLFKSISRKAAEKGIIAQEVIS
jgi:hypothetical protein